MIKEYTIEKRIYFDLTEEKNRIKKAFKKMPGTKKRMEHILDLFEQEKWAECCIAIDELPECKKMECPEEEYVHPMVSKLAYSFASYRVMPFKKGGDAFMTYDEYCKFIGSRDLEELPSYGVDLETLTDADKQCWGITNE